MHVKNTLTEYGLISKLLHWISAVLLFIQIPLGFYLVDLDFGLERLTIENIHVTVGLSIFYLVILRLLYKIFNPTPRLEPSGICIKSKTALIQCNNFEIRPYSVKVFLTCII